MPNIGDVEEKKDEIGGGDTSDVGGTGGAGGIGGTGTGGNEKIGGVSGQYGVSQDDTKIDDG